MTDFEDKYGPHPDSTTRPEHPDQPIFPPIAYAKPPEGRLLVNWHEIGQRIERIATSMRAEYCHTRPHLLVVLDGAFYFGADLSRSLGFDHTVSYVKTRSYGNDLHSSGHVVIEHESDPTKYDGRIVFIVEDIVDTGLTVKSLASHITSHHAPYAINLVTLFNRSINTVDGLPVHKYFIGHQLASPGFLVGYGMDYHGNYRYLPHVVEISPTQPNKNTTTTKQLKRH